MKPLRDLLLVAAANVAATHARHLTEIITNCYQFLIPQSRLYCPRVLFRHSGSLPNPDAGMPRLNRSLVYLGACLIACIRLARERQVSIRVIPTITAINESVDLAHEIFNKVFRGVRRHPTLKP